MEYLRENVVFEIPFVSESFDVAVSRLVECSELPVSTICEHPRSFKDILKLNRLYNQCFNCADCNICSLSWPGVYEIARECGRKNVGEKKALRRNIVKTRASLH